MKVTVEGTRWANLNTAGRAAFSGRIKSAAGGAGNTTRRLTRSSDLTREGLGMEPTQKTCRECDRSEPDVSFDTGRRLCRKCRHTGKRREAAIERQRRFRTERPDLVQQRNRAYYEANAEGIKATLRENPHLRWSAEYRRRMKRHGLPIEVVEEFTRDDVVARYGDVCAYCPDGAFEELDHFIPLRSRGPHTLDNVRPACMPCNRRKRHMDGDEFVAGATCE